MTEDNAHPQKKFISLAIAGLPMWVFFIPPILLMLAPAFDWPDGYYRILRLIVCLAAAIIAFDEYKNNRKNQASIAGLIALLFNPAFIVDLEAEVWSVIDFIAAGLWIFHLWRRGVKLKFIAFAFSPILIIFTFMIASSIVENIQQNQARRAEEESREAAQLEKDRQQEEANDKNETIETQRKEQEMKAADVALRDMQEKVAKLEIVKFEAARISKLRNYSAETEKNLGKYFDEPAARLTIKNANDFPIDNIKAKVFFLSQKGDLLWTWEDEFDFRPPLKPGDIKTAEQEFRFIPLEVESEMDLTKTKIKIIEIHQAESFRMKLSDIDQMESATPASKS